MMGRISGIAMTITMMRRIPRIIGAEAGHAEIARFLGCDYFFRAGCFVGSGFFAFGLR